MYLLLFIFSFSNGELYCGKHDLAIRVGGDVQGVRAERREMKE